MKKQSVGTNEFEIAFQSGSLNLAGTFLMPSAKGRYPAVLLLPGSGRVDRDENTEKLAINVMCEIATHLASHGIASLRFDKRGVGASQGDYWETGFYDRIADATAALEWLKSQDQVQLEKIFLLGHSEGSGISTRLAGTGADVSGIILLGGWAQSGEDLLLWQAEQVIPGMHGFIKWLITMLHLDIRKAQKKQFEKIKRSKKNWIRQLNTKVNLKWMREFLSYNPAEDLKIISVPVLAITGSKDIQTPPADLKLMAQLVKGEFESHELSDVTHLLRSDFEQPTISSYPEQVKKPIDSNLLELITEWLKRHINF